MKRFALIAGLILLAVVNTFGQTDKTFWSSGLTITLLDTYVSNIETKDPSKGPHAWKADGEYLCCLLLLHSRTTKTVHYASWQGEPLDYKVDGTIGAGNAVLCEGNTRLALQTISGVATNGLSDSARSLMWKVARSEANHSPAYPNITDALVKQMFAKMFPWGQPTQFADDGVIGFRQGGFFDQTLFSSDAVLDLLIFTKPATPIASAKPSDFILTLPAANIGGAGEIKFTLKRGDIRSNIIQWPTSD